MTLLRLESRKSFVVREACADGEFWVTKFGRRAAAMVFCLIWNFFWLPPGATFTVGHMSTFSAAYVYAHTKNTVIYGVVLLGAQDILSCSRAERLLFMQNSWSNFRQKTGFQ